MGTWANSKDPDDMPPGCSITLGSALFANIIQKSGTEIHLNTFLASSDFCRLLITFAYSLNPDQDRQNVSRDLDPNRLTL